MKNRYGTLKRSPLAAFRLPPVHLTLLVPELIWPEPADQFTLGKLAAPGLEWLLAHALLDQRPRRPFETVLADRFAFTDAPFGALRLLGEAASPAPDGPSLRGRRGEERVIRGLAVEVQQGGL